MAAKRVCRPKWGNGKPKTKLVDKWRNVEKRRKEKMQTLRKFRLP
jgi:hypothetical protein